jgi:hypothetical protein
METSGTTGAEAAQMDQESGAEALPGANESQVQAAEEESAEPERRPARRWAALIPTALFGVMMFLLGGLGGFVGRPYIMPPPPTLSAAEQQQAKVQALFELVVSKTRHFKGNANAPVTLLEFSDFQ